MLTLLKLSQQRLSWQLTEVPPFKWLVEYSYESGVETLDAN